LKEESTYASQYARSYNSSEDDSIAPDIFSGVLDVLPLLLNIGNTNPMPVKISQIKMLNKRHFRHLSDIVLPFIFFNSLCDARKDR